MKKILLFLLIISSNLFCQTLPVNKETGKVEYLKISISKKTKQSLFKNAKIWVAGITEENKSAVIKEKDAPSGKLIIQYKQRIEREHGGSDEFTTCLITIDCKQNKYRILINNIMFQKMMNYDSANTVLTEFNSAKNDKEKYEIDNKNKIDTVELKSLNYSLWMATENFANLDLTYKKLLTEINNAMNKSETF